MSDADDGPGFDWVPVTLGRPKAVDVKDHLTVIEWGLDGQPDHLDSGWRKIFENVPMSHGEGTLTFTHLPPPRLEGATITWALPPGDYAAGHTYLQKLVAYANDQYAAYLRDLEAAADRQREQQRARDELLAIAQAELDKLV
ncbi:MAG TPA: hypothetical protein VKV25_04385 [Acidimicrobiales bacterium]|nr:hypothetical protein [Acidimicrobiales bacterium]